VHVVACLVLGDQLLNLVGRQPALDLPLPDRLSSRTTVE
jgi:hypothetical protein